MSDKNPDTARRRFMKIAGITTGLAVASPLASGNTETNDINSGNQDDTLSNKKNSSQAEVTDNWGLVTTKSDSSVESTVKRIEQQIEENDLMLVATIDHAANAASVGKELRPTTLLIFGNPMVGTELMQQEQSVGIDLPQKILVWEDENCRVNVTYNDPEYLAERHGITGQDELLGKISNLLKTLATGTKP